MGVKIGNLDISAFKVGGSDCSIYLGDVKLYPSEQPSFQGKWFATYTAGTTSSAECDSSSAITSGEITLADLETVIIGDCVTSISSMAFLFCTSLTSIDIPSNVTSIGSYAFNKCSGLTSVAIGNGVTSIGNGAFGDCTSLTSIDIPSNVTSIGEDAFYSCSNLTSVTVNATTPPTLGGGVFGSTNNCPIYVPSESVETYKSAHNWSNYASRIQAIPSPYQWVTFTNGDTISSDLDIYGIKGIVNDLSSVFWYGDDIYVENAGRNKYNVIIGGFTATCYSEYDILSNTSVEYTFSDIGCSDSYTVSSKTIADMSNDIQLLIYV